MSAYHLSVFRTKGWFRLGLVGAVLMLPIAAIGHAFGCFGEGMKGLQQAAEFVAGGAVLALILGVSVGWILRGFAVRNREDDEDRDSERGGFKSGPPTASASDAKGRHAPAPTPTGRH